MKHFEASGLWFQHDDPDDKVAGTLKFDDEGLQLILLGSFRPGWSPEPDRYSMIHGVVGNLPIGSFVTLIDCFQTRCQFDSEGFTSETIRAAKATLGDRHLSEGSSRYECMQIGYSCLTNWAGLSGINVEHAHEDGKTMLLRYVVPDAIKFSYGEKILTLSVGFQTSLSAHKITLSEAASLVIRPVGDIDPKSLFPDDIRRLQDLLSFATDRPNTVEKIVYYSRKEHHDALRLSELNLVFDPIIKHKDKGVSNRHDEMLFTYKDACDFGIDLFAAWFGFTKEHGRFNELYFAHVYSTPRHLDDRLSILLKAFNSLCSGFVGSSKITTRLIEAVEGAALAEFTEDERELVRGMLPVSSDVESLVNLKRLLENNSHLTRLWIDDVQEYVRSLSDTLLHFQRRVEVPRRPLKGEDLYRVIEKLDMFIKLLILREIGFNDNQIKTLFERNHKFNILKSL